ncbi:hypothetical protein E3A20_09590 [Planctomyces bekefii]|uniref:OmpR/PhoB-type domain-containing protein n=1 Tax=Planctomyces bekefii TaxID=1653850 RepID=A0A5C6M7D9_9PLAN|nr:hypothetical protein E3A20_09590 [Planctomyces bekefii]
MQQWVEFDVQKRAELFSMIAELIQRGGEEAPVRSSGSAMPRLMVGDHKIWLNGHSLDLSRRPLMIRMFRIFVEKPGQWVTREELVERVYGISTTGDRSVRFLGSVKTNSVKLVSRARLVTGKFLETHGGEAFEWFVYDGDRRAWTLVRHRSEGLMQASGG